MVFKQAGLSTKEVKDNLETLAQAALAPNFKNLSETTEGMIAVMRQFRLDAQGTKEAIGAMNAVAGDFAVEAGDLVEAVKRSGGAFAQTGGQLNELLALFTAVRGTTRESAESIATGLRTIFTRVQRNELVESLRELQINLRYTREEAAQLGNSKLEGHFVGAYEAFRRLSDGLKGLSSSDPRKSAIIEQLGGFREVSKVIPLIENFADAQKALVSAQAGSISTALAAEKAQETLGNRMGKVREEFLLLMRNIVESKGFQAFADTSLKLANAFISVADAARPLIPLIAAVAAFKIGSSIPTLIGGFNRQFSAATPTLQRRGFAIGGVVPGAGDTDCVPAQLTPGEFVIRKQAAQKIGYERLHAMNASGSPRRMADGGPVSFADTFQQHFGKPRVNPRGTFYHSRVDNRIVEADLYKGKAGTPDLAHLSFFNSDGSIGDPSSSASADSFSVRGLAHRTFGNLLLESTRCTQDADPSNLVFGESDESRPYGSFFI